MQIGGKPVEIHAALCDFGTVGLAMSPEIIEDDTVIFCEFVYLILKKLVVTGPAVNKNQRLAASMLFIINVTVVFCGKISHVRSILSFPFLVSVHSEKAAADDDLL